MGTVVFPVFCNMSFGDCIHLKYSKKLPEFHTTAVLFKKSMGCRAQLCGRSHHLLFREGTVSDPVVGTRCCGFSDISQSYILK